MKAYGRLLCAILPFEWQRKENIQREVQFQSGLVLAAFAAMAWLFDRPMLARALDQATSEQPSERYAGIIMLLPLSIAALAIMLQAGWIFLSIARAQYTYLPDAKFLEALHRRLSTRTDGGGLDESLFIAQLRQAQANMAKANYDTNNKRQGYLTRAYHCFFFAVLSLAFCGVYCLTLFQAIVWSHVGVALVALVIAARLWYPVPPRPEEIVEGP